MAYPLELLDLAPLRRLSGTIQTAEDGVGVRPSIARFLIPLGASVNMSGTAPRRPRAVSRRRTK